MCVFACTSLVRARGSSRALGFPKELASPHEGPKTRVLRSAAAVITTSLLVLLVPLQFVLEFFRVNSQLDNSYPIGN